MTQSVFHLLTEAAAQKPNHVAVRYPSDKGFVDLTWQSLKSKVDAAACGLIELGIAPRERVGIFANTRLEWSICDLAILGIQACTVPIYHSSSSADLTYIVNNSGLRVLCVENLALLQKVRECKTLMPQLEWVIVMEEVVGLLDHELTFSSLTRATPQGLRALSERTAAIQASDLASLVYTSGTTADPKGAMLTHDNLLYEAQAVERLGILTSDDVQLLFLPLAHIFARVLQVAWLRTGHVLAFAESVDRLAQNLQDIRPTMMGGVPRVYEKIYANIVNQALTKEGFAKRIAGWALAEGQKRARAQMAHQSGDSLAWSLANRLVFSKIREQLEKRMGGRLRFLISGGAPLSPDVAYFFKHAGITIIEGWGLTETTAATCINLPDTNHIGTVGQPVPGTEIRIADDGEVLVKGRGVFSGYWNNQESTNEAFTHDGWFKTGDIGALVEGGYLRITDRKKEIIVTSQGKKVVPQKLENLLKSTNSLIQNAVVFGDNRPFVVALLSVDMKNLEDFAHALGLKGDGSSLMSHPLVKKEIEQGVAKANTALAGFEQVKKWTLADREFVIGDELTPTLKVKRRYCIARYQERIDALYA